MPHATLRLLILAWLTALAGLTSCTKSYEGPVYQGRTFSQWYQRWAESADRQGEQARVQQHQAAAAIRHCGTNVLPFLLKELHAQVEHGAECPIPPTCVFAILGPIAAPAIPELESMMQQTNYDALNQPAACLVAIGDPALPSLARLLGNPHTRTRYHAAYQLASKLTFTSTFTQGTNLLQLIPALARCTEDPNPYTAIAAIRGLAAIRIAPQTTVPQLTKALASSNPEVRKEAASALAKVPASP